MLTACTDTRNQDFEIFGENSLLNFENFGKNSRINFEETEKALSLQSKIMRKYAKLSEVWIELKGIIISINSLRSVTMGV